MWDVSTSSSILTAVPGPSLMVLALKSEHVSIWDFTAMILLSLNEAVFAFQPWKDFFFLPLSGWV